MRRDEALEAKLAPMLDGAPSTWRGASIVSVSQFSEAALGLIVELTDTMMASESRCLDGTVVSLLFAEPSTRTSCSFQAAVQRLGGSAIVSREEFSSSVKGESLEDTVRTLGCYSDVLVIRHSSPGAAIRAAEAVPEMPVINGGDGVGEHPTQALLDFYTLIHELGGGGTPREILRGKRIAMLGDLKHGRTVHSFVKLLGLYDVELIYVASASLMMPTPVIQKVYNMGHATQSSASNINDVISDVDAIYVTRLQKERFDDASQHRGSYRIDATMMQRAKSHCTVLHPLPRVDEIATDLDADPRAAYFRQMKNGMFLRMALLALLTGKANPFFQPPTGVRDPNSRHLLLNGGVKK